MKSIKRIVLVVCVAIAANNADAQSVNTNENNVANQGYDVVNYFTANSAARGSVDFSTTNAGATYYFVNQENLETFKSNPDKYLPQFDGYCSFAMGKMGKKVPVDPQTFRVDDGKLYLFYNDFWDDKPFNTIIPWINNEAELQKQAEDNWKTMK